MDGRGYHEAADFVVKNCPRESESPYFPWIVRVKTRDLSSRLQDDYRYPLMGCYKTEDAAREAVKDRLKAEAQQRTRQDHLDAEAEQTIVALHESAERARSTPRYE